MFEERIAALNEESVIAQKESPATGKRTYTVDEIQDILSISQPTAYALIKQNVFHSIRIGRRIRISKPSFDAWLDAQD